MRFFLHHKFFLIILLLVFLSNPISFVHAALKVQNTVLVDSASNNRFIIKGTNIEFYRDYVNGCGYITHYQWNLRQESVRKMKELGINAVRLNYDAEYMEGSTDGQLKIDRLLEMIQLFAQNGIYTMTSDHYFTGKDLIGYESVSFPWFKKIIEGAKARGIESYLIMNPYNEPYGFKNGTYDMSPNNTWPHWSTQNKKTLDYLRKPIAEDGLNFKGVVVLDTKNWASQIDVTTQKAMMDYDAGLMGGTANIVFSNHWYPNHGTSRVVSANTNANVIPMLIGEIGQYNATPLNPQFVIDSLTNVVQTAIPLGHNGAFPWIWAWCDSNKMTTVYNESELKYDYSTLTSFGNIINTNYYQKVGDQVVVPTLIPTTPQPTTVIPSATPRLTSTIIPTSIPTSSVKPGDANGDGKVDGLDYVVWLNNYDSNKQGSENGDFNNDMKVDGVDYILWLNAYVPTPSLSVSRTLPKTSTSHPDIALLEVKEKIDDRVFIQAFVDPSIPIHSILWYINGKWNSEDDGSKYLGGVQSNGTPKGFLLPTNPTLIRVVVYYNDQSQYYESSTNYGF